MDTVPDDMADFDQGLFGALVDGYSAMGDNPDIRGLVFFRCEEISMVKLGGN